MTPKSPGDLWRAWLMTGVRREPIDRRRIQGSHRGLKKILAEGASEGDVRLRPWRDFSSAMVRQAVNEAMNQLPAENQEVVKLAYFGGFSNQEIADELGLSITGVQRRLRNALASVSERLEHGRAIGRRAALGLALLLAGRRLEHALATQVVVATVLVSGAVAGPAPQPAAPPAHRAAIAVPAEVHQPSTRTAQRAAVTQLRVLPHVAVPPLPALPKIDLPHVILP